MLSLPVQFDVNNSFESFLPRFCFRFVAIVAILFEACSVQNACTDGESSNNFAQSYQKYKFLFLSRNEMELDNDEALMKMHFQIYILYSDIKETNEAF